MVNAKNQEAETLLHQFSICTCKSAMILSTFQFFLLYLPRLVEFAKPGS